MFSPLEQFDLLPIKIYTYQGENITLDITIFHMVIILFFIWLLLRRRIKVLRRKGRLIPSAWQLSQESIYDVIVTIVKQQAGIRGYKYLPLILCLFIIILLANLFSLFPFTFALTSQIINIFFLSFMLIMGLFITGIVNFSFSFFKIFIPEAPFFLLFLLIPIEIFSYFIRAFSIAIRLSANIMAGHTLVVIVSGSLIKLSFSFIAAFSILLGLIFALELGVAILQAYVFSILFTIYLKDSLWEASH